MIYMNWMTFDIHDSVKPNKINAFQLEFVAVLSESLLVVLKRRYIWNISNRHWKGHTNWKRLMNWSGWKERNKETSQRNHSDCNLILKSKNRRRKENIIQVLGIELKEQEIGVVEQRKANAWRKAKHFNISVQWRLRWLQITEFPYRESCSLLKDRSIL